VSPLRPYEVETPLSALDIRRPIRYARARVYSIGVRVHYQLFFARHLVADHTGSGRAAAYAFMQARRMRPKDGVSLPTSAPMDCVAGCEVVGGDLDCTCLTVEETRARIESRLVDIPDVPDIRPAPFTGTPYDHGSELD